MVQGQAHRSESVRDLDPNVRQRMAADPGSSIWVNASAGTGKTKVLTDRVLRLLLPRADGQGGTPPHKILCLTFTKAGAGEMALRLNKTLSVWAIMEVEDLRFALEKLLGRVPEARDVQAARRLFAQVVDTPGGLKIMTIHSFCQSVLSRFPLEAKLPPHFTVLEEAQAAQLLSQARKHVFHTAERDVGSALYNALRNIAEIVNEEQFAGLVRNIVSERHQFQMLLRTQFGAEGMYTQLCKILDISPGVHSDEILRAACANDAFDYVALMAAATALQNSNKTDQRRAATLQAWLAAELEDRVQRFDEYRAVFLTQKDTVKKSGVKVPEEVCDGLGSEAARLLQVQERVNGAVTSAATRDLLLLGEAVVQKYNEIKTQQAVLDFDDLIFKTESLLKEDGGAAWVLYKLDQGLDHILIDEAQDTNPEQWKIIAALCDEFFHGQGQSEQTRTVFTVGDEKQSIYSFQRASPEEFKRMQDDFKIKVEQAEERWGHVDLNISFRSVPSVLQAVDAVFSMSDMRAGLSEQTIEHISFRRGQAGLVEFWPVFEPQTAEEIDPWAPPVDIVESASGAAQLANQIAQTVAGWIRDEEILPSKERPIHAGDIMILVRTRTAFVNQLVRALKTHNVPVSGVDRMVLGQELVVEDLMALAAFALLPTDDLTLACALKSPFIGLDEEQLYALAVDREGSLWAAVQASEHIAVAEYLLQLINLARAAGPYEFLSFILQSGCPADELSGIRALKTRLGEDALDPVEELLSAALNFERTETLSLQLFLKWHESGETEIKRELGEHARQLRIMTVHGAKGLQAPIVILPDTMRTVKKSPSQNAERLLWPDKSGLAVPFWSPRKAFDTSVYAQAMNALDERVEEEYRRLLYVAMTRAEDRLYVAGYAGHRKPLDDSWYHYVRRGLETLPEVEVREDGILRLYNPQNGDPDGVTETQKQTSRYPGLPTWVAEKVTQEAEPVKILRPSEVAAENDLIFSPLEASEEKRFRRGNLTHKLLELLPEISAPKRASAADQFIEKYGLDLPEKTRREIVEETLAVLEDDEFAPIFGPDSQAEVSISGVIAGGQLVSGQIDRLLVTDEMIQIIDYKTNRPPPDDAKDIPIAYIKQLGAYAEILSAVYPDRDIRCALLSTDGPRLMPVDTLERVLT